MAKNAPVQPGLLPVGGKPVHVAFDGGRLTSDAGVLVLAEVERRLGLAERLARQSGILIAAQTKDGSGFERETLVENRLLGIKSWQNAGHGLEVRDRARNKVTDGTVRDCVFCR